jgi:hypothetical protein
MPETVTKKPVEVKPVTPQETKGTENVTKPSLVHPVIYQEPKAQESAAKPPEIHPIIPQVPKVPESATKPPEIHPIIPQVPKVPESITGPEKGKKAAKTGPESTSIPAYGKIRQILYYEDFSYSQPIVYPSGYDREYTASYQSRKLLVRVQKPDSLAIYDPTKGTDFKDYALEVDSAQAEGSDDTDYGVVLRRTDANNYYRFWISGRGQYGFDKMQNGQWIVLVPPTSSPEINTGGKGNVIKIECRGDRFIYGVNGKDLGAVKDGSFAAGGIGFGVGTSSSTGAAVSFDNLKIYA